MSTPGWENHVNVGGPPDNQRGKQRPRVRDYDNGLKQARDYLEEGFSRHGNYFEKAGRWLRRRMHWPAGSGENSPRDAHNQLDELASNV